MYFRSELLPSGWNSENGLVYSLVYQRNEKETYLLKAVAAEDVLIVSLMDTETEKSADLSLTAKDIVTISDSGDFLFSDLNKTMTKIKTNLITDVNRNNQSPQKTSHNKSSKGNTPAAEQPKRSDPLLEDRRLPRRDIDPGVPNFAGHPRVGGADLDPFCGGGITGGGMLMDPRRGRDIEPRWDPVGPGGLGGLPGHRGRGGRGGGLGGGRNFGDEMAPPGFNDDVSDDYNNMFM